jgi:nucleotide-binding universal stress UspA family protein
VHEFAIGLASRFQSHLSAIYLKQFPPYYMDPYGQMAAFIVEWEELALQAQKRSEKGFRERMQREQLNFDWVAMDQAERGEILALARAADLIVAGQRDADDLSGIPPSFFEDLLLTSGRPMLFLPYAGQVPEQFSRVVIGWNGSREAARAVSDALPLLKDAREVTVISVTENRSDGRSLPDVDIAASLARHGIKVEMSKYEGNNADPADWLQSRAADLGADLIVMGGYGHSRFGELVLGGVTRGMLRQMAIPVLMSH